MIDDRIYNSFELKYKNLKIKSSEGVYAKVPCEIRSTDVTCIDVYLANTLCEGV